MGPSGTPPQRTDIDIRKHALLDSRTPLAHSKAILHKALNNPQFLQCRLALANGKTLSQRGTVAHDVAAWVLVRLSAGEVGEPDEQVGCSPLAQRFTIHVAAWT